jgi:hypothetical protein
MGEVRDLFFGAYQHPLTRTLRPVPPKGETRRCQPDDPPNLAAQTAVLALYAAARRPMLTTFYAEL